MRRTHLSLLVFILLLGVLIDTCFSLVNTSHILSCVPGTQEPINGRLSSDLPAMERLQGVGQSPEELARVLRVATSASFLRLEFLELSGRMWRGTLFIDKETKEGEYDLVVHQADEPLNEGDFHFTVRVFASQAELRKHASSLIYRFTGISPLWLLIPLIPLAFSMFVLVYRENSAAELQSQARGVGSIYKLARKNDHWEILFGLGSAHGVTPESTLHLRGKDGSLKSMFKVQTSHEENSEAQLPLTLPLLVTDTVILAEHKDASHKPPHSKPE